MTAEAIVSRLRVLPPGATSVSGGLIVNGASAFAFLALARRGLDSQTYASLAVVWVVLFTIGPGVFVPVEQELARLISGRRANGAGYEDVIRRITSLVALALAFLATVLIIALRSHPGWSWFQDRLALLGVVLGVVALAAASLVRGVYAGGSRFSRYGAQLAADGLLRLLAGAGLLAVDAHGLAWWVVVLAAAPVVSLLVTWAKEVAMDRRSPEAPAAELVLSRAVGLLLVATLASQGLANGGVLLSHLDGSGRAVGVAGQVLVALIVTRGPMFLYAAVQASLLPRLSHLAAVSDHDGYRRLLRSTVYAGLAVSAANVVAVYLVGGWVMTEIFAEPDVGRVTRSLLAVGTAAFVLASIGSQSLIAHQRHGQTAVAWMAGLIVLTTVYATVPSLDLRPRVAVAYVAATCVTAMVVMMRTRNQRQSLIA